jgi:hypothetical protein
VIGAVLLASAVGCSDRASRSSASDQVIPFARRPAEVPAALPAPLDAAPLEAELVDPPAPHAGILEVTVALTNPGTQPVSLDPCPVYRLVYGESGTAVEIVNELNCPAAPDRIPAGGQLRFAAELELGNDIRPGFVGSVFLEVYFDDTHNAAFVEARSVRTE